MRENGLLSPHRYLPRQDAAHDGVDRTEGARRHVDAPAAGLAACLSVDTKLIRALVIVEPTPLATMMLPAPTVIA
jgi:phage shock protein PspC (stress-responsive transcriptional regulator)